MDDQIPPAGVPISTDSDIVDTSDIDINFNN